MPDPDAPNVVKAETVGTVRTTVNVTVLAAVLAAVAKVTHWEIQANDLLPFVPIAAPIVAVFYRLSLFLAKKYEWLGVVLYGINSPPKYAPPAPPLDGVVIAPPEK